MMIIMSFYSLFFSKFCYFSHMKKILSTVLGLIFLISVSSHAEEKLTIEKDE